MYNRNLIEYLPPFLREIKEYQAILTTADQPEIVLLWQAAENVFKDQFIMDATENGVSRWEKILGIVPKATHTLEERKFDILTRINEKLPFTITTLKEQLSTLCGADGYSVFLDNNKYLLKVQIALKAKNNFEAVNSLLKRIVPANMMILLSLKYNQNEVLSRYTHRQLQPFTHYQLRNEVLSDGKQNF